LQSKLQRVADDKAVAGKGAESFSGEANVVPKKVKTLEAISRAMHSRQVCSLNRRFDRRHRNVKHKIASQIS